jgi:heavy metal translocating P-type ATPase
VTPTVRSAASDQYCAFCGLPLAETIGPRRTSQDEADYCCSGCRVASAVDAAPVAEHAQRRLLLRIGLAIFFTMNVVVFTMELWTRDIYGADSFGSPLEVHLRELFQWASLVFSTPVLLLLTGPIAASVGAALRRRTITTDLLILLGVVAAYAYSTVSVLRGEGQIYFEVGCVVLVFVSIGRWLEARGKHRVGAALDSLTRLLPDVVRRAKWEGAERRFDRPTEDVPREDLCVGEVIRVLPGERLAVDGVIVAGRATLDEQIVTGESRTRCKCVGDSVYSGVLNIDGDLWVQTSAAAGHDTISRMVELVREARRTKGRHERLADRVATWFVPAVCLIAVVAAVYRGMHEGVDQGILTGLAVVVIACPCAIGLATPMAVWTALGRAAQEQVMFRSGAVLERLAGVNAICFDKTGTLTSGGLELREMLTSPGEDREAVLRWAARLAGGSTHPLSLAIQRHAVGVETSGEVSAVVVTSLESHAGQGVLARDAKGHPVAFLGRRAWMEELGQQTPPELQCALAAAEAGDFPQTCIAWGGHVRGVLLFAEWLRVDAAPTVAACKALGLDVQVLTGDQEARAAAIARELGITATANQLPADKAAAVRRRGSRIAMVGDGLNDAPALAAAEVGIALGCGADVSRDAAGVCMLSDRLDRLPWAIGLARQTVRTIRQNLFWAFAYNAAGIVLAGCGRLNPIWAAAAMGVSSVLVIGNSLRLARYGEAIGAATQDAGALPSPAGEESGTTIATGPLESAPLEAPPHAELPHSELAAACP